MSGPKIALGILIVLLLFAPVAVTSAINATKATICSTGKQ